MTAVAPHAPSVVVMGVSGVGKTVVAASLAAALGRPFIDADDLHSDIHKDAMANGQALTDADRQPWLAAVGQTLAHGSPIVACSALKRSYREVLRAHAPRTVFVHLVAPAELIRERLSARIDHYMPVSLLDTQIAALEALSADEPGFDIDASRPIEEVVGAAQMRLADRGVTP